MRSVPKSTNVTPQIAQKLAGLRSDHGISLGDIVAEAVEAKWESVKKEVV